MINYIIRRVLFLIPTLFFVTVIVFLLVRWIPGSAVDVLQASLAQSGSSIMDRAEIMHMLGLDVPVHIQYYHWLSGIITHFDFGNSILQGRSVLTMIMERLPITLELGILSFIIGNVIAIPLGIYSAARQDRISDYILRSGAILMIAVPSFWIATLIMIYPSIWWGWSPPKRSSWPPGDFYYTCAY
jgi:peptide/nickel transport system permease protein